MTVTMTVTITITVTMTVMTGSGSLRNTAGKRHSGRFPYFQSSNFQFECLKSEIVDVFLTRCRISMCQGLGRKHEHDILKTDRIHVLYIIYHISYIIYYILLLLSLLSLLLLLVLLLSLLLLSLLEMLSAALVGVLAEHRKKT